MFRPKMRFRVRRDLEGVNGVARSRTVGEFIIYLKELRTNIGEDRGGERCLDSSSRM
jgi:hypothetical protein